MKGEDLSDEEGGGNAEIVTNDPCINHLLREAPPTCSIPSGQALQYQECLAGSQYLPEDLECSSTAAT